MPPCGVGFGEHCRRCRWAPCSSRYLVDVGVIGGWGDRRAATYLLLGSLPFVGAVAGADGACLACLACNELSGLLLGFVLLVILSLGVFPCLWLGSVVGTALRNWWTTGRELNPSG